MYVTLLHELRLTAVIVAVNVFCCVATAQTVLKTIDNGTLILANDAPCTFDFTEKVDGRSKVVIRAPNGSITFSTAPKGLDEGSKIDGQSKVLLEAKNITFEAKIDGRAVVLAVVSAGGSITVNEKIDGDSEFYKCRAGDGDKVPPLTIAVANPRGKAKIIKVETRKEMNDLIARFGL